MVLNDSVPQTPSYHAVVIDAETHVPMRDVKIVVDSGGRDTLTNWDGTFSVTLPFRQLTISKRGYLTRKLNCDEVSDTIFLLNNLTNIDEVVVWGKNRSFSFNLGNIKKDAARTGKESSPSGYSFDFFQTLDRVTHRGKYKRRKKYKELLKGY